MAQQADITINDGAATPVAHTFSTVNVNRDGVAKYADRSSGIPIGYPVIILQPVESNKQNKLSRVIGKVQLPVLEQVAGSANTGFTPAPSLAFTLYGNFDFSIPDRSSLQNRKDIAAYVGNLITSALVKSMVQDGVFIV